MERVRSIDARLDGVLGVYAIDLTDGHSLEYHGNTVVAQASSIKIPILVELFRQARAGKFLLSDTLTLQPSEAVGGSGRLQIMLRAHPLTLSIDDLAVAMIQHSDNTATNKIIGLIGIESVNASLERAGFQHTRLQRRMMDTAAAAADKENISSPRRDGTPHEGDLRE